MKMRVYIRSRGQYASQLLTAGQMKM